MEVSGDNIVDITTGMEERTEQKNPEEIGTVSSWRGDDTAANTSV